MDWSWLTINKFLEFAIERKVNIQCAKCGANPFTGGGLQINAWSDEGYIPWVSSFKYTPNAMVQTSASRHIPVVRTTCVRCGHIDHYSMYVIDAWRREKEAAKSPEGEADG